MCRTIPSDILRTGKTVDGTDTTNYIWDNENIIREIDDLGSVEAEYSYNPQPYGHLVSQHRATDSSYYHFDALGSTQSLTDQSATVENEYVYEPFGKELSTTGTTDNPYTWVGEVGYYKSEETGDYTLRRREYSATKGTFESKDPIEFEAEDENLFRYVHNSPVLLIDPSGLVEVFNPRTGGVVNVPQVALDSYLANNPGSFVVSAGPHHPSPLTPETCGIPAPFLPGARVEKKLGATALRAVRV